MQSPQLIVVLDNIRSALNVGAILRTCDGAGVTALYLCGITPNPSHFKIIKTALGAEHSVQWKYFPTTLDAIEDLKVNGFTTHAVEQTPTAENFHKVRYPLKTALIFGHEITGVSREVLEAVDAHIDVPMFGKKNSLNVATTLGIVVYHVKLQRAETPQTD